MNNKEPIIDLTGTCSEVNWPSSNSVIVLDDSITTDDHHSTTRDHHHHWSSSMFLDSILCVDENRDGPPINKKTAPKSKNKKETKPSALETESNKSYRDRSPITSFGECPICLDTLGKRQLASTKCGHVFCLKCIQQTLKTCKKCPTCREPMRGKNAYHPLYLSKESKAKDFKGGEDNPKENIIHEEEKLPITIIEEPSSLPQNEEIQESIEKVTNWFNGVTPKPKKIKSPEPILQAAQIGYKRKETISPASNISSMVDKKISRPVETYKPSKYAKELHQKYAAKKKEMEEKQVSTIWDKLDQQLKKKDEEILAKRNEENNM